MELWQITQLDQIKDEASCFKVIKLILTGDYINKTNILLIFKIILVTTGIKGKCGTI